MSSGCKCEACGFYDDCDVVECQQCGASQPTACNIGDGVPPRRVSHYPGRDGEPDVTERLE